MSRRAAPSYTFNSAAKDRTMPTSLTSAQLAGYHEQGYVHVPGLLSPDEAAAFRADVHAIAERQGSNDATWDSMKGAGTSITHCHDLQFRSAAFTRLLVDKRLVGIARSIIGPNVQLHHTKMFIKPPEKGSPFPMHQDFPYFPHRDHSMIAVILHFDDAPEEKGCLRVYPGSHKLGPLPSVGSDHHLPETASRSTARRRSRQGGRRDLLLLSPRARLRPQRIGRAAHDLARPVARPRRCAAQGRPRFARAGMMLAGVDPSNEAFRFAWEDKAA